MPEKLEEIDYLRAYGSTAKELKTLTEGEAQYLAGLLDGEGGLSITVETREVLIGDRKAKRRYYRPTVMVGVAHPMIIDLCNRYGGTWFYDERKKQKTKSGEPPKPMYYWNWQRSQMKRYLHHIIPHLKIKKKQACIILKALKEKAQEGSHLTEEQKERLKQFSEQIYELNHERFYLDKEKYKHLYINTQFFRKQRT